MRQKLVPQRVLLLLIAVAVILLIAGFVTFSLRELLAATGDLTGATVAGYAALVCGVLFAIDLVCLVLAQALNSVADDEDPPEAE